MTTAQREAVDTFRDSLERVGASWHATSPAEFEATLAAAAAEPAVGAPLPFDAASQPGWVETNPSPSDFERAASGVTAARYAVADYGSVVVESSPPGTEAASLFPECHVAVLRESDVLPDMEAAFDELGGRLRDGGSAVLATGPSATADMGDLVVGAHGPERVGVVLLEGV